MSNGTLVHNQEDFENPRIVELSDNLSGAGFFFMKLLPTRFMLEWAAEQGLLKPCTTICESPSGTFGLALAMLAEKYGYKLILISDWTIDPHLKRRLIELGAHVDIVNEPATRGRLLQARLNRLAQYLKELPDGFWPSQYSDSVNSLADRKFADLLIDRVGKLDCLVVAIESDWSMCGTARFLREQFHELHVIGIDTPNSVLFGQPGGDLEDGSGLGGEIVPASLDHRQFDEVHWLTAAEVLDATRRLHREHALFMGPTSGAAYKVADWWARKNPGKKVLAIFPDEGSRYVETVYDNEKNRLSSIGGWSEQIRQEPTVVVPTQKLSGWSRYAWGRRTLDEVLSGLIEKSSPICSESRQQSTFLHAGRCTPEGVSREATTAVIEAGETRLIALSRFDGGTVAHLALEHEQSQFVDPLYVVFSELKTSRNLEFEHPFSIAARNEIVGFFVLREKAALPDWAPSNVVTLHSLRIGRSYQGNGYGKAATKLAARWIASNRPSIDRLMLAVNARNVLARSAYLSSGFQDTGGTYCGPIGIQNILEYKVG
ncbi:cysteine synthase A [Paraburkholderia sp. BL6669N2]|nr:cysteine synthase A [Paraburkholderia sp. BL6669N2]